METGDNEQIIEGIIADNFTHWIEVGWLQPCRNFKVLFDQSDQFTLQGCDVGWQAADQFRNPASLSSCSLQECFVTVNSVVAVVKA